MNSESRPQPNPPPGTPPVPAGPPRRIASQELVGREGLLEIEHEGAVYRLRVTSLGKLILTK